jgi:hypothetical protein
LSGNALLPALAAHAEDISIGAAAVLRMKSEPGHDLGTFGPGQSNEGQKFGIHRYRPLGPRGMHLRGEALEHIDAHGSPANDGIPCRFEVADRQAVDERRRYAARNVQRRRLNAPVRGPQDKGEATARRFQKRREKHEGAAETDAKALQLFCLARRQSSDEVGDVAVPGDPEALVEMVGETTRGTG